MKTRENGIRKSIKSYQDLLDNLVDAKTEEEILKYESDLVAALLGIAVVFGATVILVIGVLWSLHLFEVLYLSGSLYVVGILLFRSKYFRISQKARKHLNSLTIMYGVLVTYFILYPWIGMIFWFILLFISVITTLRTDWSYLAYMIFTYVFLYVISITIYRLDTIIFDRTMEILLFLALMLVVLASLTVNLFYRRIMAMKRNQLTDIMSQKEEISALYEEILATEEELRDQNDQLMELNDENEKKNSRLQFLAYNDTLTGIPNRKRVFEHIELLIDLYKKKQGNFFLAFIDLDNFKRINDSLGHDAGDDLLIQITTRLSKKINKNDLFGRLGGDELAIVIRSMETSEEVYSYSKELIALFSEPFNIQGKRTRITVSIGIASYPEDGKDVTEILKAADTAMYKVKEVGKNNVQFYRREMEDQILSKIEMEQELEIALRNKEFYLEYQPIYCCKGKDVAGFEALIRWNNPRKGRISPAEFIPFAEENGFIKQIGEWVLRTVCKKIREIRQTYQGKFFIAVNVSTIQMYDFYFVKHILKVLEEEQVNPEDIELEITESVFIHNKEFALDSFKRLKEHGIRISMDDFGTGYSSLSYLLDLPLDKLKIDRAFINAIDDGEKKEIVGAIISMVHGLGMLVVAEGIETQFQQNYLDEKNCDLLQGYLLNRPLGEEKLLDLLS